MANINFFALGGQDENGKNSFVLEIENDIYLINVGIKVPINNKNGIDGIICNYKYLINRKERIKGIFITHAHDDSFAALPWLLMEIKGLNIYASKFSIEVIQNRISKYKIGHSNYQFFEIHKEIQIGTIKVNSFELSNSIPGSLGFNFKTIDGDILFMTNFVLSNLTPFGQTNLQEIKNKSKNILALIMDSKSAHLSGTAAEKITIKPLIETKFQQAKQDERIIIAAYDEEMYILQEVIELAIKYKRPIAFYGRVYDFLYKTLTKQFSKLQHPQIIDFKLSKKSKNAVVLITGTWSRLYQRLVRIAHNNDVFLQFKPNDLVIMIAPPVNGLEVEGSQALDQVAKITTNILEVSDKDYYRIRPTGNDIQQVVQTLKPKFFLPIGALYRYLIVASKYAINAGVTRDRNIILQNGKIAWFKDGKLASQQAKIKEFGDVIIDGFGIGDISHSVIKERQALGAGGLVSISIKINKNTKKLIGNVHSQLSGVATEDKLKSLYDILSDIVTQKMEELEKWDYREIKNNIRKRIQRVFSRLINKEPLVVITFFEI